MPCECIECAEEIAFLREQLERVYSFLDLKWYKPPPQVISLDGQTIKSEESVLPQMGGQNASE